MDRETTRQTIRESWKKIFPADNSKKGVICPLCQSGSGPNGTGITENPRRPGSLKCWKCGFQGDAIDLIKEWQGLTYNEALEAAAEELSITIDEEPGKASNKADKGPQEAHNPTDNKQTTQTAKEAGNGPQEATPADYTEYYKACRARLNDPEAISYLQARGISPETATRLWLGYDPAADPASAPGAMGNEYKPHPAPRIIIPTTRAHYVGRAIDPDTPKGYIKMNPSREKGAGSIGLFNNMGLYKGAATVFITEGAFDALSVIEAGQEAIALNSTSNTEKLIKQLEAKPTAAKLVLCLDNDEAGNKATEGLKEALQRLNVNYVTADICGGHKDPNEALTSDRMAFIEAVEVAAAMPGSEKPKDDIDKFLEDIQSEKYKPYKTGLSFFDELLCGGPVRETLLLLLAAPGVGKTTLCAQIAERMAKDKKPVIYINLEMSKNQMLAKAISSRATKAGTRMSMLQVMQGYNWTETQRRAILSAAEEYRKEVQAFLSYNPDNLGSDLNEIRDYLKKKGDAAMAEGKEAPVIILDYLHLINSKENIDDKNLIKKAVIMLKHYALTYKTFVIGIAATNRTSNTAGRITLESGRDSSNIEYTADYQLALNYEDLENGKADASDADKIAALQAESPRRMILRILKSRLCPPGRAARVFFDAESGTFYGAANGDFYHAPAKAEEKHKDSDPTEFAKLGTRTGTKRDQKRALLREAIAAVKNRAETVGEPITLYALSEKMDMTQRQVENIIKELGGYKVLKNGNIEFTGDIDLSKTIEEIN